MAYSTQRAVSNGSMVLLNISIEYFDRTEISVLFDNVEDAREWAWVGSTNKQISFTPAVAAGVEVLVQRTTDLSAPRHEFTKGAAFTAESLDEDLRQVLHVAQEAAEGSLGKDFFQDVDMHGNNIINLADATEAQQAVTYKQLLDVAYGAVEVLEEYVATEGQTLFTLTQEYVVGSENLGVFVNGLRQDRGTAYTESTSTSVVFTEGLAAGDNVQFIWGIPSVLAEVPAERSTYTPAGTGAVTTTVQSKLRESVSVKDFGAVGDGVTDDTAAVQAAIDYAFANGRSVEFAASGFYKLSSINLPQNSTEPVRPFFVKGNGASIYLTGTTPLFTVAGNYFYDLFVDNLYFEGPHSGGYASTDSKVFDTRKLIRLIVNSCSSRYVNSVFYCEPTYYAQSVTANNCIYRGGGASGYFFKADTAFDISLNDCLVEQSYNGLKVVPPSGAGSLQASSRVTVRGGAWESLAGTAIATNSTYQLTVDNVYFEGNATDINLSFNESEGAHLGLTITNNDFYLSADKIAADYYPITWGSSAQKAYRTGGNKSNGNLHDITGATGTFNFTGDYAEGKLYNGMNTATVRVGNTPVGKAAFATPEGAWWWDGTSAFAILPDQGGYECGKIANADVVSGKVVRPKFLVGALNPQTNPATYGSTEWCRGSFVANSLPAEAGTSPNKYVVLGWKCITSGVGGTGGTDRWLECRALTGN